MKLEITQGLGPKHRWDLDQDIYLHEWALSNPGMVKRVAFDLHRSQSAVRARIRFLKRTGAWEALTDQREALLTYAKCVGLRTIEDEE